MSSVTLYKSGNSITAQGVKCDFIRCKIREISTYEDQGYVRDPNELVERAEAEAVAEDEINAVAAALSEALAEDEVSEEMTNDEVRQKAEEMGIDGYETKRIKTLEKEINEL